MPSADDAVKSIAPCYLFKSQLQQFVQKVGYEIPVYESVKEGPAHKPTFRSTVTVNNVRYDSLTGFFTRKAAEQSAAEVALSELNKSKCLLECKSKQVTETGLCKNFLQEYAQKRNYSMPVYRIEDLYKSGRTQSVIYSVEINGIKYVGAAAQNKKEAEIKAARTALLAIQASTSPSHSPQVNSVHSVVPLIERAVDVGLKPQETTDALKVKKKRMKKKVQKKKKICGGNLSPDDKAGLSGVGNSLIELADPNVSAAKIVLEFGDSKTPLGDDGLIQNHSHIEGDHPGQSKDEMVPMICSPGDKVRLVGIGESIVMANDISSTEHGKCLTPLGDDSIQNFNYLDSNHNGGSKDNSIPKFGSFIKRSDHQILAGEVSSPEAGECLTPTVSVPNTSFLYGKHNGESKDKSIPRFYSFMDSQVLPGEMSSPEWAESVTPLGAGSIPMVLGPKVSNAKMSSPEWAECLTPQGAGLMENSPRFIEETVNSILNRFGNVNKPRAYRCDGLDSLIEIANGGPRISDWPGSSRGRMTR